MGRGRNPLPSLPHGWKDRILGSDYVPYILFILPPEPTALPSHSCLDFSIIELSTSRQSS